MKAFFMKSKAVKELNQEQQGAEYRCFVTWQRMMDVLNFREQQRKEKNSREREDWRHSGKMSKISRRLPRPEAL